MVPPLAVEPVNGTAWNKPPGVVWYSKVSWFAANPASPVNAMSYRAFAIGEPDGFVAVPVNATGAAPVTN